ncbi:MAG: hypothetical protein M1602_05130 [Firmicutes bacterium]|nr:hypothetical protein [Bacillota bacterium]
MTFRLVNGDQVTGFVRAVFVNVVRLSVAGRTVFLVSANIASFRPTSGLAC